MEGVQGEFVFVEEWTPPPGAGPWGGAADFVDQTAAVSRIPVEDVQGEFVFVEGWTPPLGVVPGGGAAGVVDEIAAVWRLPVGRRARVRLRAHEVPSVAGLLEVAIPPSWPFDARRELGLRVGAVEFTNRQVESWVLD